MHIDPQITHTFIGREFGWDRVSDADLGLLQNNREAAMRVIKNPHLSPDTDTPTCERKVAEIDAFMAQYGDVLVQFA